MRLSISKKANLKQILMKVFTEPDLLIGSYSGLFSGSSGVTPEVAAEQNIPTYVISDSCRQDPAAGSSSKLGTMDPWDAVRTDIQNYGAY